MNQKKAVLTGSDFWDQRYKEYEHLYSSHPNKFIKSFFEKANCKNKKVLVPGDGDGRNGLWLAHKGMDVHAFDYSSVAVEKANAFSRQMNVAYRSEHCDVASWKPPASHYDFAIIVFLHLDEVNWKLLSEKILIALAPGGTLIAQVFSKKQLGRKSGGPQLEGLLYGLGSFDQFRNFRKIQIDEQEVELEEGPLHSGSAMVINFVGQENL